MAEFIINGGKELSGEIKISGSKNTALACIAASLLTEEEVILENIPNISDVRSMLEILRKLGAEAEYDVSKKTAAISSKNLSSSEVPRELGRKLRASVLFSGPLLSRFRKATLPYPGGDRIGPRPLSTHFSALSDLGVKIKKEEEINFEGSNLKPGKVLLEETSVTATENIMLAASLIKGKTEIHLAAAEPHVQELMRLLNLMGAKASFNAVGVIEIEGAKKLKGAKFKINPDELEVSGFSALAAATRSELLLRGADFKYLDAVMLQLNKMGIRYGIEGENLRIKKPVGEYKAFRLQSGLYPKLVSDHLPPFAVLATQAMGKSLIHEWLYDGRLRYIEELSKMGAKTAILDPHRATITGPVELKGANMVSYDVRAGLTVIIAALVAKGRTKISGIEHVERGYENLEERLQKLGAEIKKA